MANPGRKNGGRGRKPIIRTAAVDDYIAKQPRKARPALKRLRSLIRASAPDAEESISYGMPAWKFNGKPLVYIGGHAEHAGFYPTASPIREFGKELKPYKYSKGAIQFPYDKPIPCGLVKKIVKFKEKEIKSNS